MTSARPQHDTDDPWRPNLDGYHDPRTDIERLIAQRTASATAASTASTDPAGAVARALGPALPPRRVTAQPRGQLRRGTLTIDKLMLRHGERVLVPALLYHDAATPCPPQGRPALVVVPGHYPHGKAHDDYQRAAQAFAAAGYTVLAYDAVGLGERHSYPPGTIAPGTTEHTYAGLPYWWEGLTTARAFVEEARAVVDYLSARPDVDAGRVIALGSSGGATIATYLTASEPRLAGLVAATFITSRTHYLPSGARQDAEQILIGRPGELIDHDTLLRACAPRPVCVLAARSDFFPIEGTRQTVERARPAWAQAPGALDLSEYDCAHRLHPDMVDHAITVLAEQLGTPPLRRSAQDAQVIEPADLRVSASGQVRDEGSWFLHDLLHNHRQHRPACEDVTAVRAWLEERVRGPRHATALNLRYPPSPSARHVAWMSEEGVWVCGLRHGTLPARVIAVGPTGLHGPGAERGPHAPESQAAPPQEAWQREDVDLTVWVRGTGPLRARLRDEVSPAHHASSYYKHLSDLLWLGDSLAASQAWDLLRAVEELGSEEVTLVGRGYGAYLCRLVAAICPRVRALDLTEETVDPTDARRLWDEGTGAWHGIIPGLAPRWQALVDSQRHLGVRPG